MSASNDVIEVNIHDNSDLHALFADVLPDARKSWELTGQDARLAESRLCFKHMPSNPYYFFGTRHAMFLNGVP